MSASSRVYIETGNKRAFACSLEWPGLSRSGKTEEAALAALGSYVQRYAPVAARAGDRLRSIGGRTMACRRTRPDPLRRS